ncbi:MAG: BON domain-containing protein [Planctomycetota bacterium]|nr:MAG: BON domain-containing protein [Planctomycetota bacterium]
MQHKPKTTHTKLMTAAALFAFACFGAAQTATSHAADDQALCDHVEDELLFDQAVVSTHIDVSCQEGIVTLEGTVDNILAKERAERQAEAVRGVKSIVNLIVVQPRVARTDSEIQADIGTALLSDPATDSYQVDAAVDGGKVTLTGAADSWQEKQLAARVAKGVAGVTAVDNQIDVNYPDERTDAELKEEIEARLQHDVFLDGAPFVDVSVDDGHVSLTGEVGSALEKTRARTRAWVYGVENVDASGLDVEDWTGDDRERDTAHPMLSDSEIAEAVDDALLYDPRTNSFNVDVSVYNGSVTLRGTVDNLKAKRAAEQDARNTIGVYSVNNRIRVRSNGEPTDEEIRQRIENALLRNPYTESYEITVSVDNGTVDLFGTVDSYFEKAEADDVASNVRGAIFVDNNLVVSDESDSYIYDPYVDDYDPYDYEWYGYDPQYTFSTDSEIEEEINDELWWSPFVDSDQVSVTVENGTATLTGTVDTYYERQAAAENAIEGGAISVDNELKIE